MALRRGAGVPQWNIVTMMPLTTIALLCRQIIDKFRTHPTPELTMTPSIGEPAFKFHYYLIWKEGRGDIRNIKTFFSNVTNFQI